MRRRPVVSFHRIRQIERVDVVGTGTGTVDWEQRGRN